jgi:quercetin dioxygenase-like cupin family protein
MITELAENLKKSRKPVVKKIHDKNGTKVIAIGLARGVELKEHVAPCPARLMVIKGEVDFNTATESRRYGCYESYDIPMNLKHSVVAWDDAIVLLFLSEEK